VDPYHFSSQSSAHFDFNIDLNLNILNNEVGDEGEGPSVQQQQQNLDISEEATTEVVRVKTSIV
jgi:hypothetical protein